MALDALNYELQGGLEEELIMRHITHEEFQSYPEDSDDVEDEICIICQESYVDGEEIGRIDCAHSFHLECIKKWLLQKNACPLCKETPAIFVED